jgi:cyclomaltodextrinase / maltogenic alpha-amylase / neopullulanase
MINKNAVIYQVVTDRFDNSQNNLHKAGESPNYSEEFKGYLGGTFNGITSRIPYLANLGITHLMISPVQPCQEYHGYLPESFEGINPNFGTAKELKHMIRKLHKTGIKVIADYVFTHISSNSSIFQEALKDSEKRDWFLFHKENHIKPQERQFLEEIVFKLTDGKPERFEDINGHDYLGYFGLHTHPLFNLVNPQVIDWHANNLERIIKEFKFDGIRSDSSFLQPRVHLQKVKKLLSRQRRKIDLITEYWDFETSTGFEWLDISEGGFDIRGTLALNGLQNDSQVFHKMLGHYYRHKDAMMRRACILSLDNHDLPRFQDGEDFQKIAAILQFTFPTIPLVYYGDEIGMKQYNNGEDRIAQSRDPLRFDLPNPVMFDFYKRMIQFRKNENFSEYTLSNSKINDQGELFSYQITLGSKNKYYVILNKENRPKPIDVSIMFPGSEIDKTEISTGRRITLDEEKWLLASEKTGYLLADSRNDQKVTRKIRDEALHS